MLPGPVELRIHVYDELLERGSPPTVRELATHFHVSESDARAAIANLKIGKTLLPHPRTGEIWMAGPFSAEPTDYAVTGQRTTWFANCAWDMLGVAIVAREPVSIETRCGDCGDPIRLGAVPDRPARDDLVVLFLVPARRWYDDVGFS